MRKLLRFLTALVRRKKSRDSINQQYWQGEYGTLAQNIGTVLRLTQQPVTRRNVMAFTVTLPLVKSDGLFLDRTSKLDQCLVRTHKRPSQN